jgi:hypothetical protein
MVNTIDPDFFTVNIANARHVRKNLHAAQHGKIGQFKPDLYELLKNSNQIARGK